MGAYNARKERKPDDIEYTDIWNNYFSFGDDIKKPSR